MTPSSTIAIDQGGQDNHEMIAEQLGKWHHTSCCCDLPVHNI